MRVIKCTGKNRQAILDDAGPIKAAESRQYRPVKYNINERSDGSTYTTPAASEAPFEENLEYWIRSNNAFYVHTIPGEDDRAEVCYFMVWKELYNAYNFRLPSSDDEWFTAIHKHK